MPQLNRAPRGGFSHRNMQQNGGMQQPLLHPITASATKSILFSNQLHFIFLIYFQFNQLCLTCVPLMNCQRAYSRISFGRHCLFMQINQSIASSLTRSKSLCLRPVPYGSFMAYVNKAPLRRIGLNHISVCSFSIFTQFVFFFLHIFTYPSIKVLFKYTNLIYYLLLFFYTDF